MNNALLEEPEVLKPNLAPTFNPNLNVKALLAVKQHVVRYPASLNMNDWWCGTVGCIAGHLCAMYRPGEITPAIDLTARTILGIERLQSDRLFLPLWWPERHRTILGRTIPGTVEYAQAVADRIDHFIETGE